MSELEESFEKLLGRQPTDADKQRLYRVRDALGLKSNDALWLVLMALDHYQTHYEAMPQAIAKAAGETLAKVKDTAERTLGAAAETTRADLARAVSEAARTVARTTSQKEMWRWALGCVAAVATTFTAATWFAFDKGEETGHTAGYEAGLAEIREERVATSWATTPEGKAAYRLSLGGDVRHLLACDYPGWKTDKGVCFPKAAPDGSLWGWRLEQRPTAKR